VRAEPTCHIAEHRSSDWARQIDRTWSCCICQPPSPALVTGGLVVRRSELDGSHGDESSAAPEASTDLTAVETDRLVELERAVDRGLQTFVEAWRARLPLAIVICGVPAAGKSQLADRGCEFARALLQAHPRPRMDRSRHRPARDRQRVGASRAAVLSDFSGATVARLAARGHRLAYDGQGLVRVPRIGELTLDARYDPEVLRHLTVLKLSEDETAVLAANHGRERALERLSDIPGRFSRSASAARRFEPAAR
jgi:hypothetical protein